MIWGLLVGLGIGSVFGVLVACLLFTRKDDDNE